MSPPELPEEVPCVECKKCGARESNSATTGPRDYPTVCRNCGASGDLLVPFLQIRFARCDAAALPAIEEKVRRERDEELRKRLLSDDAVFAAHGKEIYLRNSTWDHLGWEEKQRAILEAVLDSIFSEDDDGR